MAEREKSSGTFVIGLGHFGLAVTVTPNSLEREILGVESDSALAEQFSPISPVVETGASRLDTMERFGVRDFSAAVVGVGAPEASVLITVNPVDIGMKRIWVKAVSRKQGKILRRVGAYHAVYPKFNAGRCAAHLVDGRILDHVEMGREGFSIVKMRPSVEVQGFVLAEFDVRHHYGVSILGVIPPGQHLEHAGPDTVVAASDLIIVSGDRKLLDNFANRPWVS